LKYLAVEPDDYSPESRYPVVILMHGYGASMADLASLSPAISSDGYVFIYPNGPIAMQVGPGMTGYAWNTPGGSGDHGDGERTEEMLEGLFEDVREGYDVVPGDTVLGGFSQGGMMAYGLGLPRPELFAGLIILSSRVSEPEKVRERLPADRVQPIFVAHGTSDSMISVDDARKSRDFLQAEGYSPDYHEYPMGHEITQALLDDLVPWLNRVLAPGPRE
jgi:phospholipase/carboxylesterase